VPTLRNQDGEIPLNDCTCGQRFLGSGACFASRPIIASAANDSSSAPIFRAVSMREAMRIGGQGEMLLSISGQKGEGSGGEQASLCSARPAPEEGGLRPPAQKDEAAN
jgi:hypothetical protein